MNSNNNNNSCGNIDNDLNQEQEQPDNEILFWKVFHNKYLLHVIFEKIENALVIGERKKFKDITTLDWLIRHKQYSLLKCKLEAGEHIDIEEHMENNSLSFLFNNLFKKIEKEETNEITEYKLGDEYKYDEQSYENKVKMLELNQINLKQSFYLLLKYKPKELLQIQLIKSMTYCHGHFDYPFELEELIDHLLSTEPYCSDLTLINSDTIKSVIKSFPPSILSKLLNHLERMNTFNTIITDDIKNTSISLVVIVEYSDSMLDFILNNNQLYNIPQIPSSSDKVIKLDILIFISIKSSYIQNKLLHLNYIGYKYVGFGTDEFKMKFKELLNNDNYIGCNEEDNIVRIKDIFKLIVSESPDKSNGYYYKLYISKYDEIIIGQHDMVVLEYSLESKSINGLKYLLSPQSNINKPSARHCSLRNNYLKPFSNSNESTNEFIELYTTNYQIFGHFIVDSQLLDYVFSITSNEEYEQILKSIIRTDENKRLTDLIPVKWYHIPLDIIDKSKHSKRFIIKDTDTIDLLLNGFDYFKLLFGHLNNLNNSIRSYMEPLSADSLFKYETYQLIDYVKSNYSSIYFSKWLPNEEDNTILKELYMYPFSRAINNCDIESLKHIDQLLSSEGVKFDKFQGCKSIDKLKYSNSIFKKMKQLKKFYDLPIKIKINFNYQLSNDDQQQVNKIIELVNYFNSSGYKLFSNELFIKFISDISRLELMESSSSPSNSLSNSLNINFKLFPIETIFELILNSISNNINPNIIQLILNNFNPFIIDSTIINPIIEKWEDSYNKLYDTSYYNFIDRVEFQNQTLSCLIYSSDENSKHYISYSYESSNNIISTIKLLLQQHIIQVNNNYSIIEKLINHLFKRLIKVNQVSIYQVQSTYELIKSKWLSITSGNEFIFQHSLYHIFYYLSIRSSKLVNYILELQIGFLNLQNYDTLFDNANYRIEHPNYYSNVTTIDPLDYFRTLKSDIYSYHYIFNNPVDEIYNKLNNKNIAR